MKNKYFNNIVKVEVTGKNIDNYIKKIIRQKINILNLTKNNSKSIYLYLNYKDYLTLKKQKTIYEIKIISYQGKLKLKQTLHKNIYLIISLILSILLLYILSNIIFDIKIIHSNREIIKLVSQELDKNNLKKHQFKRNYQQLEKIEDKILNDNKDKLEWIEITTSGTKYIIRVEERIKNKENSNNNYQNIVSTKSAIITKIQAQKGEVLKRINDYVSKDDIIISGKLTKPDNSNIYTHSEGLILGETWYNVEVEYPYIYKEETYTGNSKQVLVLNFLNKRISLFNFNKYKSVKTNTKTLLYNNILPINLVYEKQYEVNIIDDYLTNEEVINKAKNLAKNKLLNSNNKIKEIIDIQILTKNEQSSKIKLKLFIKVIEDITKISPILDE